MTEQDKIFDGSENKEDEENQLPPFASNNQSVNLWIDEDKNGDNYLRIDAPFLKSERVFIQDDCKEYFNQLVSQWEEDRENSEN